MPGCSTGEEAYSIAILMREHMDTLRVTPKLQIFATDIDEGSLAVARYGNYPNALLQGVSQRRLDRFFSKQEGAYTVAKEIRDFCIFSTHSVIRDPPFSRLDLISCRNLLIYLGSDFQARVIPAFHFALRPGGFLFLGSSTNCFNGSTASTGCFSGATTSSRRCSFRCSFPFESLAGKPNRVSPRSFPRPRTCGRSPTRGCWTNSRRPT